MIVTIETKLHHYPALPPSISEPPFPICLTKRSSKPIDKLEEKIYALMLTYEHNCSETVLTMMMIIMFLW